MANLQQIEPEATHLREEFSFIRNACGEDPVKGTDAIRGDEQELVAKVVNIANLALAGCHAREMALRNRRMRERIQRLGIVGHTTGLIDE